MRTLVEESTIFEKAKKFQHVHLIMGRKMQEMDAEKRQQISDERSLIADLRSYPPGVFFMLGKLYKICKKLTKDEIFLVR